MQMLYAEVIVDISREACDRPFSYILPERLCGQVVPGTRVRVPFGKGGRMVDGYVIRIGPECSYDPSKMKEIAEAVTGAETAEGHLILLASWMSRTCGGAMVQALKTVLPAKKKIESRVVRRAYLVDADSAEEYIGGLGPRYSGRIRTVQALLHKDGLPVPVLRKEADISDSVLESLQKDNIIRISFSEEYRKVVKEAGQLPPDTLTGEQAEAVAFIRTEWESGGRPVLLAGVTGSGKTLVYMELIADVLSKGRQAIVLIPEIALTWQTVLRFVGRFGDRVSFLHSRLSNGEKYDQMKAAKKGDVSIMVGPRSALFTPFERLGLIVIDEEHEETYRSETVPRYHVRETAIKRAELEGAHVLMGSATPSLTASWRAEKGIYAGFVLKERYGGAKLPETVIVDMRKELETGNRSIFSSALRERLADCLKEHRQAMLFLNRRGYAGFVTCRSCGFTAKCPHCDVSLTRHANGKLVCHYCGYEIPELKECPVCHSKYIGGIAIGTEQVEEIVHREFPEARILRMDMDTTRGKGGHGKILERFGAGEADILIGTQMIVKGHDFPSVTLVGVLMADLSLNEADYRSAEHTFELITQAVGRAGRGSARGTAVIQTYHPEHYAIRCAAQQDYTAFYQEEIAFRKIMNYPPAGRMMAVLGSALSAELLATGMDFLRKYIDRINRTGVLFPIGPAPQAVGKIKDHYRSVIYLRSADEEELIRAKNKMEDYIRINKGFEKMNIQFDFNV